MSDERRADDKAGSSAEHGRLKRRTHEILEGTRAHDPTSEFVQWFIIALILLNVVAVVLASMQQLRDQYQVYFRTFEIFSVVVFSIEYVARVWSCTVDDRFDGPVKGRLRFMATPAAIIDLVAIAPFYIPRIPHVDFRAIRTLRLFRLFRLLKLGRYSTSVVLLVRVLRDKKEQIVLAFVGVMVLLVLSSSIMYYAERTAQPDHFGSIPQAMWWGVITLTTVGYGNVYPVTAIGKVFGGMICLLGIGLFALPAGILSSGFQEAIEKKQELRHRDDEDDDVEEGEAQDADQAQAEQRYCPCCGRRLEDEREAPVTEDASDD